MAQLPGIQRLYLIGLMGAGKSTVARILASVLDWRVIDLDHEIETVCGQSISSIFDDEGETGFRNHEAAQLLETRNYEQAIIACGGGIVLRQENLDLLSRELTVWLELSPAEAAVRLEHSDRRPLLAGCQDTVQTLNEILLARQAAYEQAASLRVPAGGLAPEVIASQILRTLGSRNA